MLKLDSNLDLDIHNVDSLTIRLPHLKLLHLRTLVFKEDEFVTKLVKSCPLLEDLLLHCWWRYGVVLFISSPLLLKLVLVFDKHGGFKGPIKFTIETPNLQCFKYIGDLTEHYSIANMTALVHAEILCQNPDILSGLCPCTMLKSCSTVTHLSLLGSGVLFLNSVELKNRLPVFHNLIHLELSCLSGRVLVPVLECCPSLNTLIFPQGFSISSLGFKSSEGYKFDGQFWRTTRAIPSCFESHLKNVVMYEFRGSEDEHLLVQNFLKKALVLENLVISLHDPSEAFNSDQDDLQSLLRELPRASTVCSIRVLE